MGRRDRGGVAEILSGVALALIAGCALPASTAAPMQATTVGHGHVAIAVRGEIPVANVVADTQPATNDYKKSLALPTVTAGLAYGVAERTDVEGEVQMLDVVAPTGIALGVHQHVIASDSIDLGVAARVGALSNLVKTDTSKSTTGLDLPPSLAASAWYGSLAVAGELHEGVVRPLVALEATPFRITRDVVPMNSTTAVTRRYWGHAESLTLAAWIGGGQMQVAPFVALAHFASDTFSGGWIVSGGIALRRQAL